MQIAGMSGLGLLAALLQVGGYSIYLTHFLRRTIQPNAASWLMFAYGTALLAFLESESGASSSLLLLPLVCAAMSIVVAGLCMPRGATAKIDKLELYSFSADLGLTALYVAMVLGMGLSTRFSGLFLVLTNLTAITCFIPIVRSTWKTPDRELPGPWAVWSLAYTALGLATWTSGAASSWELYVYPAVNAVLHGAVALFALRSKAASRRYVGAERKIYISQSDIHGSGTFAGRYLAARALIWRMTGRPVHQSASTSEPNLVGISADLWIDPDMPIDSMNHSCNPNAAFGHDFELVALRSIAADEEITFDYSTTEADPRWEMDCNCGAPQCRKKLYAIQIAFADQPFPPPASPPMQQVWRTQRRNPSLPAFPQMEATGSTGLMLPSETDVAET